MDADRAPPVDELASDAAKIIDASTRIPLAIEFAAASAQATLGIEHVAGNLRDRFAALLTGGRRTKLSARQRTPSRDARLEP